MSCQQTTSYNFICFNKIDNEGDEIMSSPTRISVYTDASLNRRNLQEGVGGGGVCLIPGELSGSEKEEIITFSQVCLEMTDINEGEAWIAHTLIKWINDNFSKEVPVRMHLDSADVLNRTETLQKNGKWFCDCSPEDTLLYECNGNINIATRLWGARFRNEKIRARSNCCKYCGGKSGGDNELSQTVKIQNQVQEFFNELEERTGLIELVKVPAHKNCWGNNMADILAKSGRKLEGIQLEIGFDCVDEGNVF
jgi:ribonuclease HI